MTGNPNYRSAAGEQEVMALYDKVLARWPVPADLLTIPTRHGDTFVIASGDPARPALVLLHGASSNALAWMGDIAAYSRRYRVLAVDIPGEPGRSSPNRLPWRGPAHAEWLEDVLDSQRIDKVSLVGLSQGGWVALQLAVARPERAEKLVLLAPGGIATARMSFVVPAVLLSLLGRRGAMAIVRLTSGGGPIHPDAARFMGTIMAHFRPRIGALPLLGDAELRSLSMPMLLVIGARDPIIPADKTAARLKRLVPNLTSIVLPDAGHVLHNSASLVLPFLDGSTRPDSPTGQAARAPE